MKKKITILALFLIIGSNLFAQSTAGDSLFNDTTVHSIYINFSQVNYWTLLQNNKAYDDANDSSTYIPAQVIVDGQQLDSVGIQFKGNSSYYNYPSNKKPFTLSFNEYISGQKYNGLKNINLNNMYQDPSFMREKMFLDFCNAKAMYAPRANYARLYINGNYWGLYLMVERITKTFLKDRFGDNDDNLWKGDGSGSSCADLKYHGTLTSYYNCYELKTNELANDWSKLINLTYQINMTTNTQFRDSVEAAMNTQSFISAWAAFNLFVEFDSYPYRFIHNYYIYHDSIANKFQFIVWDASTAFGMDVPMTIPQIEAISVLYVTPLATDRPLVNRMLANSVYKDTYLKTICSFADNDFLPSVLNPKIDTLYNRIKNFVYAETMKMYSNQNFDDNITQNINVSGIDYPGLKPFIQNRSASVLAELNTLGYTNCPAIWTGINETNSGNEIGLNIYPNPFTESTTLQTNKVLKNATLTVYNSYGQTVKQIKNIYGQTIILQRDNLSSGLYFIRLTQDHEVITANKFIITD
ncbi:MAG: CotH kinase family protein [Bacteroidia bacterium]|nr:CotH kinase family protein [Bacteroidia bacterium]